MDLEKSEAYHQFFVKLVLETKYLSVLAFVFNTTE